MEKKITKLGITFAVSSTKLISNEESQREGWTTVRTLLRETYDSREALTTAGGFLFHCQQRLACGSSLAIGECM